MYSMLLQRQPVIRLQRAYTLARSNTVKKSLNSHMDYCQGCISLLCSAFNVKIVLCAVCHNQFPVGIRMLETGGWQMFTRPGNNDQVLPVNACGLVHGSIIDMSS